MVGGGERLIIRPIVMKLNPEEVSRLVRTLLDEDEETSFAFLVECLKPKLISATRDH
jgi:hypothetical protein